MPCCAMALELCVLNCGAVMGATPCIDCEIVNWAHACITLLTRKQHLTSFDTVYAFAPTSTSALVPSAMGRKHELSNKRGAPHGKTSQASCTLFPKTYIRTQGLPQ
jgi:hypothetical protein